MHTIISLISSAYRQIITLLITGSTSHNLSSSSALSSGEIWQGGGVANGNNRYIAYAAKMTPKLSVISSTTYTDLNPSTNSNVYFNAIAADSTTGGFVAGGSFRNISFSLRSLLAKFNSSGAITWAKEFSTNSIFSARTLAVGSAGDVFFSGPIYPGSGNPMSVGSFKSDGTAFNWKSVVTNTNVVANQQAFEVSRLRIDALDNIYVTGYVKPTTFTSYSGFLLKFNSAGTLIWQKVLTDNNGTGSTNVKLWDVTLDSSGNIYTCGVTGKSGVFQYYYMVTKYDSSGNIIWNKIHTVPSNMSAGNGFDANQYNNIKVDADGTVYVSGQLVVSGATTHGLMSVYNSSGTRTATTAIKPVYPTAAVYTLTDCLVIDGTDLLQGVNTDGTPAQCGVFRISKTLPSKNFGTGSYQWASDNTAAFYGTITDSDWLGTTGNITIATATDTTLTLADAGITVSTPEILNQFTAVI